MSTVMISSRSMTWSAVPLNRTSLIRGIGATECDCPPPVVCVPAAGVGGGVCAGECPGLELSVKHAMEGPS
jgi:hypothetical protein